MKKYDSYKNSGIEWIGEIPSHWEVKKVKHLTRLQGGYAFKSDLFTSEGIPVIRIGDIADSINFEECKKIDDDTIPQEYRLEQFDTLIALSGATTGKTCFIGNAPPKAYVNQRVEIILFSNKLLYYIINSGFFQEQILLTASGSAQENISNSQIENLEISISNSQKEQTAIAAYLDRKTAEIDELIADKKRLLELYEEEKTAIINQAVTKGINPDAPMKDSGIEWLAEIPEHWEVKRLKTIARVQTGRTPKIQNSQIDFFDSGEINWFTPADFDGNNELSDSKRKLISEAIETGEVEIFPEYSIYLVSIGATLGKVSFFRQKASANQQINIIIFNQTFNPLFGYYFLVGNKEMITLEADYTTLPILNQSKTKSLLFAVPPLEEQQSIVRHIETECARIDAKKSKTEKLIELLTEYRTALISEVVTGKIKVID
jgi:type I restriction enzyme S subunit